MRLFFWDLRVAVLLGSLVLVVKIYAVIDVAGLDRKNSVNVGLHDTLRLCALLRGCVPNDALKFFVSVLCGDQVVAVFVQNERQARLCFSESAQLSRLRLLKLFANIFVLELDA